MRYEHINKMCNCGNSSDYIWKGVIMPTTIRRRDDTVCIECLGRLIRCQTTSYNEWELLTEESYKRRMNENERTICKQRD